MLRKSFTRVRKVDKKGLLLGTSQIRETDLKMPLTTNKNTNNPSSFYAKEIFKKKFSKNSKVYKLGSHQTHNNSYNIDIDLPNRNCKQIIIKMSYKIFNFLWIQMHCFNV